MYSSGQLPKLCPQLPMGNSTCCPDQLWAGIEVAQIMSGQVFQVAHGHSSQQYDNSDWLSTCSVANTCTPDYSCCPWEPLQITHIAHGHHFQTAHSHVWATSKLSRGNSMSDFTAAHGQLQAIYSCPFALWAPLNLPMMQSGQLILCFQAVHGHHISRKNLSRYSK